MLTVDLTQHELRPVMDKQEFPFTSGHPQTKAIEEGAVAVHPGGFNITLYHGWGIQDQPQHALVVDGEIWTTLLLTYGACRPYGTRHDVGRQGGGYTASCVARANRSRIDIRLGFGPR
jgi:hypothetical protein